MKRILLFACLCGMVIYFASCNKKDEPTEEETDEITIYGNVIDRTTGLPLYNVLIQEKNNVGGSTVTGNDGNYEFTLPLKSKQNSSNNLFNGYSYEDAQNDDTYRIVASKDKYSSSEYELKMSNIGNKRRIKIDFQLTKESITYVGTVVDSKNDPIPDAHISAEYYSNVSERWHSVGTTAITDANGAYNMELSGIEGQYRITASKNGYKKTEHIINQSSSDKGKTITLNFTMVSY